MIELLALHHLTTSQSNFDLMCSKPLIVCFKNVFKSVQAALSETHYITEIELLANCFKLHLGSMASYLCIPSPIIIKSPLDILQYSFLCLPQNQIHHTGEED